MKRYELSVKRPLAVAFEIKGDEGKSERLEDVDEAARHLRCERARQLFGRDVLPKCLKATGVSAQPQGRDYYAYLVRYHTTTTQTPDQIHELGLKEVVRIRAEMNAVAAQNVVGEEV